MMLATLQDKFRWSLRKNLPDLAGILKRQYPDFVLAGDPSSLRDEIPVFVFHSIEPIRFSAQLHFLRENGYTTLVGDELLQIILGKKTCPQKAVVLTFDDGTATLYSVAYPLLKKYGFRAISFIIPGCIPERTLYFPTYEEVLSGKVTLEELLEREDGEYPLCSWQEIQEMHLSGVIDFQAHSMYHHLISISPRVVDFIHPDFDRYFFSNIRVPVYHNDYHIDYSRRVELGTPVYKAEPRMSGLPQYFDNVDVRRACIEYVRLNGGKNFFTQRNWRRKLRKFYSHKVKKYGSGKFEAEKETYSAILEDFQQCKDQIESHLSGKKVDHFCFPWFTGSKIAMEAAREAGYQALYWGMLPDVKINKPGSDPFRIVRLDGRYIFRLPGKGRWPLRRLLQENYMKSLRKLGWL